MSAEVLWSEYQQYQEARRRRRADAARNRTLDLREIREALESRDPGEWAAVPYAVPARHR
jgi:hypothetical protein